MKASAEDKRFLKMAARLGRRNLGATGANPSVGCILVKDNRIIARGVTAPGGRPHAETVALAAAGMNAKGATAYITLEPCAHHGKTPPCAEALIKAGITRAVFSISDPDPRVNGAGEKMLREAGVAVEKIHTEEAADLHAGFLTRITQARPYVTLKLAVSQDGNIAGKNGEQVWITNELSLKTAHLLRAEADAILVGVNTVIQDNPALTCRLPGLESHSPVPVVLDGSGRIPKGAKLLQKPLWIFSNNGAEFPQATDKTQIFYTEPAQNGKVPIKRVCQTLAENGINRLLVEGGASVAQSFLEAGLVDEVVLMESPKILGENGIRAIGPQGLSALEASYGFRVRYSANLEGDRIVRYARA